MMLITKRTKLYGVTLELQAVEMPEKRCASPGLLSSFHGSHCPGSYPNGWADESTAGWWYFQYRTVYIVRDHISVVSGYMMWLG